MADRKFLKVEVIGEDKSGSKALQSVGDEAEKTEKKVKRAGDSFKGAAIAVGGQLLSSQLGGVLNDLGATAVELDIFGRKTKTVFGSAAADVSDWADKNARAMGLTDRQLEGLAANFGDLMVPMGFAKSEAADMSKEVLNLAGALSAWSGNQRSSAEVANVLTKAMLGERDELKSLGISISEAEVQQRLFEKGQKDLTGAALQQAEALATQELIFEKSTDAQKAWADGSLDGAKKANAFKAALAEIREEIAVRLGPSLSYAGTAIEILGPMVAGVGGITQATGLSFGELSKKVGMVVGPLTLGTAAAVGMQTAVDALAPSVSKAARALAETVPTAESFEQALEKLRKPDLMDQVWLGLSKGPRNFSELNIEATKLFRTLAEDSPAAARLVVQSMEDQGREAGEFRGILEEITLANAQGADAAKEQAQAQTELSSSFDKSKEAADSLKTSLDQLIGVHLTAEQANIAYEAAVDKLTESFNTNGISLDNNEAAGRANSEAILGMIDASLGLIDAESRAAGTTDGAAEAQARHTAQLRETLAAAGLSTDQINALLMKYRLLINLPNISKTIDVTTRYTTIGSAVGNAVRGIQQFASGIEVGPVKGRRGEPVPVLAHGGEWVVTPAQMEALRGSGSGAGTVGTAGGAVVQLVLNTGELIGSVVLPGLLQLQGRQDLGIKAS